MSTSATAATGRRKPRQTSRTPQASTGPFGNVQGFDQGDDAADASISDLALLQNEFQGAVQSMLRHGVHMLTLRIKASDAASAEQKIMAPLQDPRGMLLPMAHVMDLETPINVSRTIVMPLRAVIEVFNRDTPDLYIVVHSIEVSSEVYTVFVSCVVHGKSKIYPLGKFVIGHASAVGISPPDVGIKRENVYTVIFTPDALHHKVSPADMKVMANAATLLEKYNEAVNFLPSAAEAQSGKGDERASLAAIMPGDRPGLQGSVFARHADAVKNLMSLGTSDFVDIVTRESIFDGPPRQNRIALRKVQAQYSRWPREVPADSEALKTMADLAFPKDALDGFAPRGVLRFGQWRGEDAGVHVVRTMHRDAFYSSAPAPGNTADTLGGLDKVGAERIRLFVRNVSNKFRSGSNLFIVDAPRSIISRGSTTTTELDLRLRKDIERELCLSMGEFFPQSGSVIIDSDLEVRKSGRAVGCFSVREVRHDENRDGGAAPQRHTSIDRTVFRITYTPFFGRASANCFERHLLGLNEIRCDSMLLPFQEDKFDIALDRSGEAPIISDIFLPREVALECLYASNDSDDNTKGSSSDEDSNNSSDNGDSDASDSDASSM